MHTLDDSKCIGQVFGYFVTYEINGQKKNLTLKFKYISKTPISNGQVRRQNKLTAQAHLHN